MSENNSRYIGEELDLFSQATNWKAYWSGRIAPLLGTRVLEVGAGMGANTSILCGPRQQRWLSIEPDERLMTILMNRVKTDSKLARVDVRLGTLDCIHAHELFDSILYIDVLEHIDDDRSELERAGSFLRKDGSLIVLAPAHQWLYSPFDKAVGHFRRYSKRALSAIGPSGLALEQLYYIDTAGLIASMGNLLLLRKSLPTMKQIELWDSRLIPLSMKLDPWLRFTTGKTIIAVWKKR